MSLTERFFRFLTVRESVAVVVVSVRGERVCGDLDTAAAAEVAAVLDTGVLLLEPGDLSGDLSVELEVSALLTGVYVGKDSSSCSGGGTELSLSMSEGPPIENEDSCSSTPLLSLSSREGAGLAVVSWARLLRSGLTEALERCRYLCIFSR